MLKSRQVLQLLMVATIVRLTIFTIDNAAAVHHVTTMTTGFIITTTTNASLS